MCFLKNLVTFIITLCLITTFTLTAHAEVITIEADGSYNMGKNDSQAFAEESAYQDALRRAADQAGVHVESYSETHNFKLTKDEVRVTSAAILNVIYKNFEYTTIENQAFKVICRIKAEADTSKIDALMADNRRSLGQSASADRQVAELQQRIVQLEQDAANRAELERQYLIKAYEKNLYNAYNNNSDELIKHYINEIRQLDPTNAMTQYVILNYYDKQYAIDDALNILKIDPDNYIACISLAQNYYRQSNEQMYDYYARKAIKLIRKNLTPDEIKRMTLTIVVIAYPSVGTAYPSEFNAEADMIDSLYGMYLKSNLYVITVVGTDDNNYIVDIGGTFFDHNSQIVVDNAQITVDNFINKFKKENDLNININYLFTDLNRLKKSERFEAIICYTYSDEEV